MGRTKSHSLLCCLLLTYKNEDSRRKDEEQFENYLSSCVCVCPWCMCGAVQHVRVVGVSRLYILHLEKHHQCRLRRPRLMFFVVVVFTQMHACTHSLPCHTVFLVLSHSPLAPLYPPPPPPHTHTHTHTPFRPTSIVTALTKWMRWVQLGRL